MASLMKNSFQSGVKAACKILLKWLEKEGVKLVLKKLAIAGGFKAWIIAWVVGELIEEADERIVEPLLRKLGYIEEVRNGTKIYKRIENAQDVDDWRDAVRDA